MPRGRSAGNGEGSVFRLKNGRWIGRVSVPGTGGTKRKSVSGKTRKEAEEKMQALRRQLQTGTPLDRDTTTVREHLEAWLENTAKSSVAPTSYERYVQVVRLHLSPLLGDIKLKNLNPAQIEALKTTLLKSLAPGTVNHALTILSAALNQAVKWDLIPKNPKQSVRRVREDSEGMRCLTEDESAALVEVARGTRREALYQLALKCGLRIGELLALKWEDLEGRELKVRRGVNTNYATPRWRPSTKTGQDRSIILEAKILDALARHKKIQVEERLRAPTYADLDLIFPDELGEVKRERYVLKELREDLEVVGLLRIRFHDLRDTCGTLLLGRGVPLHVVSKILGHADPAMTLRRYAHVLPDAKEQAARAMGSLPF